MPLTEPELPSTRKRKKTNDEVLTAPQNKNISYFSPVQKTLMIMKFSIISRAIGLQNYKLKTFPSLLNLPSCFQNMFSTSLISCITKCLGKLYILLTLFKLHFQSRLALFSMNLCRFNPNCLLDGTEVKKCVCLL